MYIIRNHGNFGNWWIIFIKDEKLGTSPATTWVESGWNIPATLERKKDGGKWDSEYKQCFSESSLNVFKRKRELCWETANGHDRIPRRSNYWSFHGRLWSRVNLNKNEIERFLNTCLPGILYTSDNRQHAFLCQWSVLIERSRPCIYM